MRRGFRVYQFYEKLNAMRLLTIATRMLQERIVAVSRRNVLQPTDFFPHYVLASQLRIPSPSKNSPVYAKHSDVRTAYR